MNRLVLVLVLIAVAPMFAFHEGIAQAQTDPLNNAYQPTVDCTPADYPTNIDLSGPLVKLRQDSGTPGGVTGAAPCITVMATQNEFQSFQVHVQAPSGGYSALNVTMSALTKSTGPGNSFTIPAPSASANDIVVYREGYIHITKPSSSASVFYGSAGYYPDPLIPAIDPYYHQTTAAFPVNVAAGANQSAWIDVYIPQTAPSGWYQGTVTISNGGTTLATMPVIYGVWQWPANAGGYMPSTATLRTIEEAGYNSLCSASYTNASTCDSAYPGGNGTINAVDDLAVQLLDNRLDLSYLQEEAIAGGQVTTAEQDLLNGVATNRIQRIMPGSRIGQVQFDNGSIGSSSAVSSWINLFNTNGWYSTDQTFDYLVDEPGSSCSGWKVSTANATRGFSTPNMPILVTGDITDMTNCGAQNSVDWLVTNIYDMDPQGGTDQRSNYTSWLSGNCCSGTGPTRELWSYLSCEPNCGGGQNNDTYPNYDIDSYPVANRVMEWISFQNQQSGELYYMLDGCFWNNNGCGTDPWASNISDGNNGDGDLLYPGSNSSVTSAGAAQVGVTTPIWIPSIRIKMMRDGIQDYEYMTLLTNQGKGTLVQTELSSWVTNSYTFSVNPAGLTAARQALGTAIHDLTYSTSLLPPPSVNATLQQ